MRILDCKNPSCKEIAAKAPLITDYLCDECKAHYNGVKQSLTQSGISFIEDPHIVRGLDYYTKTVFEFIDEKTGLAILAGGRYDGLVKEIDGKAEVCGLGFASGIERLVSIMEREGLSFGEEPKTKIFIANIGEKGSKRAELLTDNLRALGIRTEMDLMDRSLKAQMKYADKIGAEFTIVLGDDEVVSNKGTLKNMVTGEKIEVSLDEINKTILK